LTNSNLNKTTTDNNQLLIFSSIQTSFNYVNVNDELPEEIPRQTGLISDLQSLIN